MAKTYTPEQLQAISYRAGHLQIIASAGSGKTTTISRRCAELIKEGTEPARIIAFTFTEKAAAVLRSRIEQDVAELMGKDFLGRLGGMYIGTIHAFCLKLLQANVPEYGNFDALDEHQTVAFVSRHFADLELSELDDLSDWTLVRIFLDNVSVVENELLDPTSLPDSRFKKSYILFCELLREHRLLTFGQMITLAVAELRRNPSIARGVEHVIVDEYQDINPAQEELIRLLASSPAQLTVVGDDLQAIYQWRGTSVENILTFSARYHGVKQETLTINRRSRPEIIKIAEEFGKSIHPRLPKEMKPYRANRSPEVITCAAQTPEDEAEVIARTIELLVQKGYQYSDISILVRSVRTSSEPFINSFRRHHIPFRCSGRTGLFLEPEASLFGRTYAWLVDCDWSDAIYGRSPVRYKLDQLVDQYAALFSLQEHEKRQLARLLQDWKSEVSVGSSDDLVRDFYLLLQILKVYEWNPQDLANVARLGSIARFTQVLVDFESMSRRARLRKGAWESGSRRGSPGNWLYRQLYLYMQYYAVEAYEGFVGEESYELNAVDISTVHQAKGLEWDCVFVSCLSDSRFPSRMMGTKRIWYIPHDLFDRERYEGTEIDERRLFYVAMTRARDILYLTTFRRIYRIAKPSRFLTELTGGALAQADRVLPIQGAKEDDARKPEERRMLSFSELSLYEFCPYAFRLRELLGFQPQVIERELGYGRALHHVMRRIAEEAKATGQTPPSAKAVRSLNQDFFLPYATQQTYLHMKQAAEKTVDRYLSEYSSELASVWETERPFWLHLDDVSITGRADVVFRIQDGSAVLVDYKTRVDQDDDIAAFQLQTYSLAAEREGLKVASALIHDLGEGKRTSIDVTPQSMSEAGKRTENMAARIFRREFEPRPGPHCRKCDVHLVCKAGLEYRPKKR